MASLLFSIILIGLFWLATTPGQTVGLTLAFAAGLSMIFLPCTLPLIFIIVPLSMGKGYRKGLTMALLFGLGLAITIGLYGVGMALAGEYVGLDKATRVMWLVAGAAAFVFGLIELKLLRLRLPAFTRMPQFIQQKSDYAKSFLMGLLLGNAGVGCPNPAFYVLLTYIATVGDASYGGLLGVVHGIGRALPLIALSILAILGVNATEGIMRKKETIDKVTAWALVFIGAFIFMNGVFGHLWYETSVFHSGLNKFWGLGGESLAEAEIEVEEARPYEHYGPWAFLLMLYVPVVIRYRKTRDRGELIRLSVIFFLLWLLMFPLPGGEMG